VVCPRAALNSKHRTNEEEEPNRTGRKSQARSETSVKKKRKFKKAVTPNVCKINNSPGRWYDRYHRRVRRHAGQRENVYFFVAKFPHDWERRIKKSAPKFHARSLDLTWEKGKPGCSGEGGGKHS